MSQHLNRQLVTLLVLTVLSVGCGTTKSRTATEQLLMSEALDRAVSQIDFSELAGHNVYFDTKYLVNTKDPMFIGNQKGLGFVNAEYVTSSLRQQMVAAGLKLQDKVEDADYVVEARLGAIGYDNNEVIYGLPASNPISAASSFMPNVPPVPAIPELSVARKNLNVGAAKVGVFAYDRKTREAVWQAGISQATSDSRDMWLLGVGPFQQGSIYRGGTQFAGTRLRIPYLAPLPPNDVEDLERPEKQVVDLGDDMSDPFERFSERRTFRQAADNPDEGVVRPAVFIDPAGKPPAAPAANGTTAAPPAPGGTPAGATASATPASPTPSGTPANNQPPPPTAAATTSVPASTTTAAATSTTATSPAPATPPTPPASAAGSPSAAAPSTAPAAPPPATPTK